MRLAVIVYDYNAAAHIGGGGETFVRTFELPDEIADYINEHSGQWSTVSLGIEDEKT